MSSTSIDGNGRLNRSRAGTDTPCVMRGLHRQFAMSASMSAPARPSHKDCPSRWKSIADADNRPTSAYRTGRRCRCPYPAMPMFSGHGEKLADAAGRARRRGEFVSRVGLDDDRIGGGGERHPVGDPEDPMTPPPMIAILGISSLGARCSRLQYSDAMHSARKPCATALRQGAATGQDGALAGGEPTMNDAGTLPRHMLDIRELTPEAFAPYGEIIAPLRTGGQGAATPSRPRDRSRRGRALC